MGREILIATISTAVPFITILIGMFLNNKQFAAMDRRIDTLERYMDSKFAEVNSKFAEVNHALMTINADLRQFYHLTGVLEGKVANLEKRE